MEARGRAGSARDAGHGGGRAAVALLSASLLFVGILAWQAHATEQARAAGARRALQGFAEVAAFQLAAGVYQVMERDLPAPLAALDLAEPGVRGVDALLAHAGEVRRCGEELGDAGRWSVRLPLAGAEGERTRPGAAGPAEWAGTPPGRSVRAWVLDRARAAADGEDAEAGHALALGVVEGELQAVLLAVRWRPAPEGTSLYGLRTCLQAAPGPSGEPRSAFRAALESRTLLPPALTGPLRRDSIVTAVAVLEGEELVWSSSGRDAVGPAVERSAPASGAGLPGPGDAPDPEVAADTARLTLWAPYDALRIGVALTPAVAARLAPGPRRASTALPLGLFGLNALLLAGALVQMRRERLWVRRREDFVRAVSHELRTPLQQMLLYGDLLSYRALRSPEERARAAEVVSRETRRLVHLTENVLRFRDEGGGASQPRAEEPCAVDPLLAETVREYAPLAADRDVRIELESGAGVRVACHPDALRSVVVNLLDNAVKYGPEGGTVRLRSAVVGGRVRIVVEDEGPGVAPGERERVFEPYYRTEAARHGPSGGTGIGLSVVRDIVESAGGAVGVGERPGGGAVFSVELPVPGRNGG